MSNGLLPGPPMSLLDAILLGLVCAPLAARPDADVPDLDRWDGGAPRIEHFAIGWSGAADRPLGLVRHLEGTRDGVPWMERDTHWLEPRTRVLHVECPRLHEPLLVWREMRRRGGRTLLLVQDEAGGPVRAVEWEGGDATRTEAAVGHVPTTPLVLLHALREDRREPGALELFDPLARATEPLTLGIARAPLPGGQPLRLVEARRPDGELALRAVFAGRSLLAWQDQEGGPVAHRIGALRHDALLRAGLEADAP